ncbi:methyltransferase domain-containing protein [Leptospira sp. WS39.C2]
MNQEKMLNLGCGARFHKDWLNIDFSSNSESVIEFDLRKGIPLEAASITSVYSSHVLEHFEKKAAPFFLKEIHRVLEPGGIVRIVVPDLEQIVRAYLFEFDKAIQGNKSSATRMNWLVYELIDQVQRNYSGGETIKWWNQDSIPEIDFIRSRLGNEFQNFLDSKQKNRTEVSVLSLVKKSIRKLIRIMKNMLLKSIGYSLEMAEIGKFRLGGEVHYWMYDSVSLTELLLENGFNNIKICKSNESEIPSFNSYLLDIDESGNTRKPDSLFIEARK